MPGGIAGKPQAAEYLTPNSVRGAAAPEEPHDRTPLHFYFTTRQKGVGRQLTLAARSEKNSADDNVDWPLFILFCSSSLSGMPPAISSHSSSFNICSSRCSVTLCIKEIKSKGERRVQRPSLASILHPPDWT